MPSSEENLMVNPTVSFTKLKERVANSRFRKVTHCFSSANFMVDLFAGKSAPKMGFDYLDNLAFFNKEEDKPTYSSAVVQQLFEQSSVPEHVIFHIDHPRDMHAYVVEKISDGKTTEYRIHQSWLGLFTLGQWLGIDEWPSNLKDYSNYKYGQGNLLTRSEVTEFIQSTLEYCTNYHEPYLSNQQATKITRYKVNHELIAEEQLVDNKVQAALAAAPVVSIIPASSTPTPALPVESKQAVKESHEKLRSIDFDVYLNAIKKKMNKYKNSTKIDHISAFAAAETLYTALKSAKSDFLSKESMSIGWPPFKEACLGAIKNSRRVLEEHRGWKPLLAEISSAILSVVCLGALNYATGRGMFGLFPVQTDSAIKLNELTERLNHDPVEMVNIAPSAT